MISIVIPAYNEEKRIGKTLSKMLRFLVSSRQDYEIVVVEDGKDATADIVRSFAKKNNRVQLFHFPNRLGKGGAVKKGLELAKGDVLLYDADAACSPEDAFKLVRALDENDVAIGSRYLSSSRTEGITSGRFFASRVFNLLARFLFGLQFSDTQCGFKAVRKDAAKKLAFALQSKGFAWDIEFLYRAKKMGLKICELPVDWSHVCSGPLESQSIVKTGLGMLKEMISLRFNLWFSRKT